jgi:hypothetical protein
MACNADIKVSKKLKAVKTVILLEKPKLDPTALGQIEIGREKQINLGNLHVKV